MQIFKPLSIAAVITMGLAWGQAQAAAPAVDAAVRFIPQATGAPGQAQDIYYVQRIPGTNKARRVYRFDKLDADGDGQLARSELPRAMHDLRSHFIEADWDRNGRLSPSECLMYSNHTAPMYTAISHGLIFMVGPGRSHAERIADL